MFKKITILWVFGLVTLVPYGIYYLLFHAQTDEYALWITLLLFWIIGFWGMVGPLVSAIKIRQVFKLLENVKSKEELQTLIQNPDTRDAAIEMIASENRIPHFLATKIYNKVLNTMDKQDN